MVGGWLELIKAGNVARWRVREPEFIANAPLRNEPLVTRSFIFLSDEERTLYRASREQPDIDLAQSGAGQRFGRSVPDCVAARAVFCRRATERSVLPC